MYAILEEHGSVRCCWAPRIASLARAWSGWCRKPSLAIVPHLRPPRFTCGEAVPARLDFWYYEYGKIHESHHFWDLDPWIPEVAVQIAQVLPLHFPKRGSSVPGL